MSSLWKVIVLDKGEEWIDLNVIFDHPDAGAFPEEKPFALSLLTQEACKFNANYERVPNSSLAEDMDFENSYDMDYLGEVADNYIKDVKIYEAINLPWDEDAAHEKMKELCRAEGLSEDDEEWDDKWGDFWRDFWADSNNLPQAKYRIKVTDKKWINHLHIGQEFDSASYGITDSYIYENIKFELPVKNDGVLQDILKDFKNAHMPPRTSEMDNKIIYSLCKTGGIMPEEELKNLLEQHTAFLANGGRDGSWTLLQVSGLPLNLYSKQPTEGTQLKLNLKQINPETQLFKGKSIECADLAGAVLENVSFKGSTLNNSLLTNSFMAGACFENAELISVDFTDSDLRNANFRGANLTHADFEIAHCEGADFTGAILDGASFKGTYLSDVKR